MKKLWSSVVASAAKLGAAGQKVWGTPISWWKMRSKRAKLGLIIGTASAVLMAGLAVFLVLFLRPVFVVEAMETEDAIVQGEEMVVTVDVANEGRIGGEYELRLLVDDHPTETEQVSVDAGSRTQITFSLSGKPAGRYDVALAEWPSLTQKVWVMTPPEFEIIDLVVEPEPFDLNTTSEATVCVTTANVGEALGTQMLELTLDGEVVDTLEIELSGRSTSEELLPLTIAEPGSYEVAVNGECVDLEAYRLGRPKNGEVLVRKAYAGPNSLKIKNNGDADLVVALVPAGEAEPFLAIYVHAQSECKTKGIKSDTYDCYYSYGEDWCTYRKAFTKYQWCEKFDETMKFRASAQIVGNPSTYTIWTVELGGTSDGESAPTSIVMPEDFPEI